MKVSSSRGNHSIPATFWAANAFVPLVVAEPTCSWSNDAQVHTAAMHVADQCFSPAKSKAPVLYFSNHIRLPSVMPNYYCLQAGPQPCASVDDIPVFFLFPRSFLAASMVLRRGWEKDCCCYVHCAFLRIYFPNEMVINAMLTQRKPQLFDFDFDLVCRAAAHLGHTKWNAKRLYVQTIHEHVKVRSGLHATIWRALLGRRRKMHLLYMVFYKIKSGCSMYRKIRWKIMPRQTKWSRRSGGTRDRCCGRCQARCPCDASDENFVVEFAIEKMGVQAFHLLGSNASCVLPNDCH